MSLRRKPQPFRNRNEYSFSPFRAGQDAWCCHEIRAWDVCRPAVPGSLAGAEAAAGALCGACVSAGAAGHGAKRSVGRRRTGGVEGWTTLAVARTGDFGLPDADKDGRPVRGADALPALRPVGRIDVGETEVFRLWRSPAMSPGGSGGLSGAK